MLLTLLAMLAVTFVLRSPQLIVCVLLRRLALL